MVDAIVSFAVERLGDSLIQKAALLGEVSSEVKWLRNELRWMQCFIKDAENKQVDEPLILQWVSDIRDIAYEAEDVFHRFMLQVCDEEIARRTLGPFASIKKLSSIFTRYHTGKQIIELRKRLGDVSRRRIDYGLENINIERGAESHTLRRLKQVRRTVSFSFEKNVVGYEDDFNSLLKTLIDNEPRRFVISIWGTGGLGKTTLASKLYRNNHIKSKFNLCAWVSVSQDYNTLDLLWTIMKSFSFNPSPTTEELERMKSQQDLERYLHKSLLAYSYLVVIDDVWEIEAWESLKRAFPDNEKGSRVIITTRIKEVAECSDNRTRVHKLRFLRPDESWELFCKKTFPDINPDETLQELGREMVKKCGGLPLAIVVLSGFLSTKTPQEWHSVRDHLWRDLRSGSIHISNLLALSFNDLSYQLKLCFLHLSLFPEDFEFNTARLIRQWVAEGFIPHDEEIMEDIAYKYLNELINRSLIQVEKIRWGEICTCRVHDLLRDLAISKARELNFADIYDDSKNPTHSSRLSSCRRLAVHSGIRSFVHQQYSPPLRSLFLFVHPSEITEVETEKFFSNILERFRFLRVLDLKNLNLTSYRLGKHLGKLIHLKYLGLGFTKDSYLPTSILNLSSLETLELKGTSLRLPTKIWKLQQLRHLIGFFYWGDFKIDNLTNLQTLKYIPYGVWHKANPETLVNLRELRILQWTRKETTFTFDSITKLQNLQILEVHFCAFSSLEALAYCRCLLELVLRGKIDRLPRDMHTILPNLERLSLVDSYLSHDPMPILETLPNLIFLQLENVLHYEGKIMICTANGFRRLEILVLRGKDIEELQVEEGCMPMLRGLHIAEKDGFLIPKRLRSIPPPPEWESSALKLYLRRPRRREPDRYDKHGLLEKTLKCMQGESSSSRMDKQYHFIH